MTIETGAVTFWTSDLYAHASAFANFMALLMSQYNELHSARAGLNLKILSDLHFSNRARAHTRLRLISAEKFGYLLKTL